MTLDFAPIIEQWSLLVNGATVTLRLAAVATLFGFVIGTLCAIGRNSSLRWVSGLCAGYVEDSYDDISASDRVGLSRSVFMGSNDFRGIQPTSCWSDGY